MTDPDVDDEEEFHSADEGDEDEVLQRSEKSEPVRQKKNKPTVSSPISDDQMKSCESNWSHSDLCSKFESVTSKLKPVKPSPSASPPTHFEIPREEKINPLKTTESDGADWNLEDWGSILSTKDTVEKPSKPSSLSLQKAYPTEPKEAENLKENIDQTPQASNPPGTDEVPSYLLSYLLDLLNYVKIPGKHNALCI